jgi:hypothetical protein
MTNEQQALLQETHDSQIRIEGRLDAMETKLADHHSTLYGNGQPGLKDRVTRLETKVVVVVSLVGIASGVLSSLFCGWFAR